jgi:hypothetical protein
MICAAAAYTHGDVVAAAMSSGVANACECEKVLPGADGTSPPMAASISATSVPGMSPSPARRTAYDCKQRT